MWWESDAVDLLIGLGLARTKAVSLVGKIKNDDNLTAGEAGMWAKVVTMLGGAAVVYSMTRPSQSARVIDAVAKSQAAMLRTAMGYRETCGRQFWYPTPGKGNRWDLVTCPLNKRHKGLHADANHFPFMAEEDIPFFNQQHRLATEG